MLIAMTGLFFVDTKTLIYVCIALVGFGNSNIFPDGRKMMVLTCGAVDSYVFAPDTESRIDTL